MIPSFVSKFTPQIFVYPEVSLRTIVEFVNEEIAVVALLLIFPEVKIVASFESIIFALKAISVLLINSMLVTSPEVNLGNPVAEAMKLPNPPQLDDKAASELKFPLLSFIRT